jgi:hypothetical protein
MNFTIQYNDSVRLDMIYMLFVLVTPNRARHRPSMTIKTIVREPKGIRICFESCEATVAKSSVIDPA